MTHRIKRQRGFTLIEMVVTVALVGVLAALAMPVMQLTVQRAKESELRTALRQIRSALDAYKVAVEEGRLEKKVDASGYPATLQELVGGVTDQKQPDDRQIYFLRRLPRDPMNTDKTLPAQATWGLRSYASTPDAPQAGKDVFDVYSLSERVGINGIAYKEW